MFAASYAKPMINPLISIKRLSVDAAGSDRRRQLIKVRDKSARVKHASLLTCNVFGRQGDKTSRALKRPATEKRQGTKAVAMIPVKKEP